MRDPETAAVVALLRVGRRPWPVYSEMVENGGSAIPVLQRELMQTDHHQTRLLPPHDQDELIEQAATDIAAWEAGGIKTLTVLDPAYPPHLRAVHDRPPLLFLAGRLERRDQRALAVIGSRNPSSEGVERAEAIADHLAGNEYTVVSGLAAGIDTAAHITTLAKNKRTVAVIGTGLCHSYPPQNAELQETIAATGALISQFWPQTRPSRKNFPMRNAVMSGLTLGTVIVEASQTSGARVQARLALAHGRPVFLAEPLLTQTWAQTLAGRPGVRVFREPVEITSMIERLRSTDALVA
jgi:DNA processing protein